MDLFSVFAVMVGVVGWTLAGMTARALAAARRGVALAARAAHEIRGPLCGVGLGVEGLAALPAPDQVRRLDAIGLELDRATLAVDELSHAVGGGWRLGRRARTPGWRPGLASRMGGRRGRARERPAAVVVTDVAWLARTAEPGWQLIAATRGAWVEVTVTAERAVVAVPPARLAQALGNLVANAAEHGGGRITVSVARAADAGAAVVVEVTDDGAGLAAPLGDLLALPAGVAPRGHGLQVAAQVAAAHRGRLSTAPSARGARLRLELPAAAEPGDARGAA